MAVHKISKGLDVPIAGEPTQQVDGVKTVTKVAVVAADFPTMKPKMMVNVGDTVKCGQPLFEDRKPDCFMWHQEQELLVPLIVVQNVPYKVSS